MKKDDLYVIEDFVAQFQSKLNLLKDHMELFNLPPDRIIAYEKTVEMLEDKLKQMKKAKNKKGLLYQYYINVSLVNLKSIFPTISIFSNSSFVSLVVIFSSFFNK